MKILYTSPFVPYPPVDGGRMVNYHYVRGLAALGHRLTLVLPLRRPEDRSEAARLEEHADVRTTKVRARGSLEVAAGALARGESLRVRRHTLHEVERVFASALDSSPDIVLLNSLFTAYLIPVVRAIRPGTPVVLHEENVESRMFRRLVETRGGPWKLVSFWEEPRIRRAEATAAMRADRVLTLSAEDARALRELAPECRVDVVAPSIAVHRGEEIPPPPDDPVALFLGAYRWPPNRDGARWLVRKIWPRVREHVPQARLVLAGDDPSGEIARLAGSDGIEAPGFVPDASRETRRASVCLVPLRFGGGTRLKILEALANERPVVTTGTGVEGLPFVDGEHLRVADDAEAFAAAVVDAFRDPDGARRLARAGRMRVEENFSPERAAARLEEMLRETMESR